MKKFFSITVFLFSLVFLVACASDKGPAELAIKAAEETVNTVKGEASKYVPDQLHDVENALNAAKDTFAKGDYKAALAAAKDLPVKAKELTAAIAAKKAELTKSWEEMSASLPKTVDDIKAKIEAFTKSKKLPAGIDKGTLDSAKAGLETITNTWSAAQEAFKTGDVADALAKAATVKDKAAEIMATLGMEAQQAAQK